MVRSLSAPDSFPGSIQIIEAEKEKTNNASFILQKSQNLLGRETTMCSTTDTTVIERHPAIEIHAMDSPAGPEHNFPCPVCRQRPAILTSPDGFFHPCYQCEAKGFHLVKASTKRPRWWRRFGWTGRFWFRQAVARANVVFFYSK